MPQLLGRTVLAPAATVTVDTAIYSNFVLFCSLGEASAEIYLDGTAPDGYRTPLNEGAPIVVVTAAKVIITGLPTDGATVEVYAA